MTPPGPILTREIAALPSRADDAHKGDVGRIVILGGCCDTTLMAGAPALAANAALRAGAGLVQLLVPEPIRTTVAVLAPCATLRTLPSTVAGVVDAVTDFAADTVAIGPGLGNTLEPDVLVEVLNRLAIPIVLDADGLNRLGEAKSTSLANPDRIVMTPHTGELLRLLSARGDDRAIGSDADSRGAAALALVEKYGGIAVLKGQGTIVTDGSRLYTNETGNAGMATGGMGDVLTGVIAALIGQRMDPLEAAILGVYLHGLAGDFGAEEMGRWSLTATDLIEYLHVAFAEHQASSE